MVCIHWRINAAQANSNYFDVVFSIRCVSIVNRKDWSGKCCTTIPIVLHFSKKLHALQERFSVIRSCMCFLYGFPACI